MRAILFLIPSRTLRSHYQFMGKETVTSQRNATYIINHHPSGPLAFSHEWGGPTQRACMSMSLIEIGIDFVFVYTGELTVDQNGCVDIMK